MPSRYTRLWRVLPFAIMRFNMVSYRYRSRLLSNFSAILFQLFSVTSGFSLSLSTDTNHIETHSGNRTQRIVLQSCTSRTVATVFECISIWCERRDSNPHGHYSRGILSPLNIPISPLSQI